MTLQKLLYYVQAWHLAVTDEPLFGERFKAWKDGPVVPDVWHSRRDQASRRAKDQVTENIALDAQTSDLIDLVLMTYGSMSGDELSALTHVEEPWRVARGDLPADAHCAAPISTKLMAEFYRAHRRLGGRTAADLAAAGVYLASPGPVEPVNVDEMLSSLGDEFSEPGEDVWGGANLHDAHQYQTEGIQKQRRRAHAGA